ncbi:MAG: glycosyl transferase [Syntrophaceae bacterium]|nr:glycosyl transferase [Syntrophaceae bacterium]
MKYIEENPDGIKSAEIVIGIPSYNEASSIFFPTEQADKGLVKYYSNRAAVIINCDNDSDDGTGEAFLGVKTQTPKIYVSTESGVRGKGNNLKNLFLKAVELDAKAIVVVDADLKSITPLWVRNLCEPVLDNYDFVAPLYIRHKYDVTVTNNIAYPLTRSLYGRRVRQPMGGDVAFSGALAKQFVETEFWTEKVGAFGIDIWMTTIALRSRSSVIQSFMGKPKLHKIRDLDSHLDMMFEDVVSTMFDLMIEYESFWREVKWSRPTAVFGFGLGDVEMPPPVEMDTHRLWENFIGGIRKDWDLYADVISRENLNKLEEVVDLPVGGFEFPAGLWAKIIYDFAISYRNHSFDRSKLVRALIPIHYGKTLSFVTETQAMNNQQVEEFIEDQCAQFEKAKSYLVEKWFA